MDDIKRIEVMMNNNGLREMVIIIESIAVFDFNFNSNVSISFRDQFFFAERIS